MRKYIVAFTAAVVSLTSANAFAGGWGGSNGSLINVSPSVDLGKLNVLNGTSVLNNSAILSGNNVSGILNGNDTGIANGVLSGIGVGILSGNNSYKLKK